MDHRREELERKRAKLAELRRQREERKRAAMQAREQQQQQPQTVSTEFLLMPLGVGQLQSLNSNH